MNVHVHIPIFHQNRTKRSRYFSTFQSLNPKQEYKSTLDFKGRRSMILPHHVGRNFFIHNGKTFISVHVSAKMLGHKFGEFASTRKKPLHKKKKK